MVQFEKNQRMNLNLKSKGASTRMHQDQEMGKNINLQKNMKKKDISAMTQRWMTFPTTSTIIYDEKKFYETNFTT